MNFFPAFFYFLFGRSIHCRHRFGWKVLYRWVQHSGFLLPALTQLHRLQRKYVLYSCFLNFLLKFDRHDWPPSFQTSVFFHSPNSLYSFIFANIDEVRVPRIRIRLLLQ
jgi:hypothetical protein